ncbi:MAG: GNAT family N-acetyltransferase [Bacteroidetes bacterium]|nr:GNAT family N-acetyltransferase [Bacteroidota bacterium]
MKNNITWHIKLFNELTAKEFHDLLQLRIDVFVVEQNCPYPELDNKDLQAVHIFATNEHNKVVAVARVLPAGISYAEVAIGRVATSKEVRMTGLGHELMKRCLNYISITYQTNTVRISAQKYLEAFYTNHGFIPTGKEYLEDNIPHLEMLKTK